MEKLWLENQKEDIQKQEKESEELVSSWLLIWWLVKIAVSLLGRI